MNTQELLEEIRKDSQIDPENLNSESLRIPVTHAKYLRYRSMFKSKYNELNGLLSRMKLEKRDYYTGRADPEVYAKKPFGHKIIKSEVDLYINADEDVLELESRINNIDNALYSIDSMLKRLMGQNWTIRNAIEFLRFKAGL